MEKSGSSIIFTKQELKIMKVIWEHGSTTARIIHEALSVNNTISYNTIVTMLRILEKKGALVHSIKGRAFLYTTLLSRQQAIDNQVKDLTDRYFYGDSKKLLHFLSNNVVKYQKGLEKINFKQLSDFITGLSNPPPEAAFLSLIKRSYRTIIALENEKVVGFITAISDGILSAYIPYLEVLPDYQSRSVDKQLILRMMRELRHICMIDLICDEKMLSFCKTQGMGDVGRTVTRIYSDLEAC